MPKPTLTLVISQDQIDPTGVVSNSFFENVLGLSLSDVLVTDESDLHDFAFNGNFTSEPEWSATKQDLNACYALWDAWVLAKLKDEYGVELPTTRVSLVWLFALLDAQVALKKNLH
jgi:hypothetical protein